MGLGGTEGGSFVEGQVPDENPLYGNNYNPNQTMPGMSGAVGGAVQLGTTAYEIGSDMNAMNKYDVNKAVGPYDTYNPRSAPPSYKEAVLPEELQKGAGAAATMKYAGKGASAGAAIGTLIMPGLGTAIGGAAGAIAGGTAGVIQGQKIKKKRNEFMRERDKRKAAYKDALNNYYDNDRKAKEYQAKRAMDNQRGGNYAPMYNASIYGLGRY